MSVTYRWVGTTEDELDRVAETRARCYAHASKEVERYKEGIRTDHRAGPGDFLLAERDGVPVGTAASLPLRMWIRGAAVQCQGVAYVGTIKTARRSTTGKSTPNRHGVATGVMHETLRLARERGAVVSALMPFRASFYEHFGYGLVERRADWTVPLSILPSGPFDDVGFFERADLAELIGCHMGTVQRGQCDFERLPAQWDTILSRAEDGFVVVDRGDEGAVRAWAHFRHRSEGGKDMLRVPDIGFDDPAALLRLLHFFSTLRDQYHALQFALPVGLPLNRLLRETQLPHRPVNHVTADCRIISRMQLRVIDHKRLLEAMHLPAGATGSASVVVHESPESEAAGSWTSRFRLSLNAGRAEVSTTLDAQTFECQDATWAAIVCGDLRATAALALGLATGTRKDAEVLDAFAEGPAPFSREHF